MRVCCGKEVRGERKAGGVKRGEKGRVRAEVKKYEGRVQGCGEVYCQGRKVLRS